LRRLSEDVDHVLCLGDLVDYGPDTGPCLRWLRDRRAVVVRGNHDLAVGYGASDGVPEPYRRLSETTREFTLRALDPADLDYLRSLPASKTLKLGGVRFHLVHATPSDPYYAHVPPAQRARWAEEAERAGADVLLVGHTHLPMVLRLGRRLVVNPGSVGQPRDGDPRAAYAIVEDGEPRLLRAEYDVEATVSALARSGLPADVVERLARTLRSGGAAA
jgi:putative phosphoesterase